MRAIQTTGLGQAHVVDGIPEPQATRDKVKVQVQCVGNNAGDVFGVDSPFAFRTGQTIGCDFAGKIVQLGPDVPPEARKVGESVYGVLAAGGGFDLDGGAFAEYVVVEYDRCFSIPSGLDPSKAASLGVGIATMAVGFYQSLGIPLPDKEPNFGKNAPFFVYAGSTATGLMAIQFARLSGFRVLTTCSPHNFDLVKQYGADEAYDYHDDLDTTTRLVKASVGDDLNYFFNCILSEAPGKLAEQVLSISGKAKYTSVMPSRCSRSDVASTMTFGHSLMADPYNALGKPAPRSQEQRQLGTRVFEMAGRLIAEKQLRTAPVRLGKGLEGALAGVNDLRLGKISGFKVVNEL